MIWSLASKNRLCVLALATGLVVLGVAGPAAAWTPGDIAKLPIGHVNVADHEEGKLSVTARCVPTKALLETLAERTAIPIVFEGPVRTYVMVEGIKSRPIDAWMRYVSNRGMCNIKLLGNKWVVSVVTEAELKGIDGTLTEPEIIEKWSWPKPECVVPENGIRDGILILNGHYIPAPYKIEVRDAGNGRWDVLVNGVVAYSRPVLRKPPPEGFNSWPEYQNRPIEIPESGQFVWRSEELDLYSHRLYRDALDKALESQEREVAAATAKQHLLDFLNTQQFFIESGDPETVTIWDSKRGYAQSILPENLDPNTGLLCNMSGGLPPAPETMARKIAAGLAKRLPGRILVIAPACNYGSLGESGFPGGYFAYFADVLSQSRDRSLFEREAILSELVVCPDQARFLAVNLYADVDLLLPELRRLQAEREKQFHEHVLAAADTE